MNQRAQYDGQRNILEEEIRKQYAELQEHKPNILIVGRTGAGKSSLINAITGKKLAETGAGRPITQSYSEYSDKDNLLNLFDSKGWEGGEAGDRQFREDTNKLLSEHRKTNPDEHIHIVWYVLQASDARFQEFDAQLVREAFGGIPVLFVLTKCDLAREEAIADVEEVIRASSAAMAQQATRSAPAPRIVGIVRTAADPLPVLNLAPWGMEEVVRATRAELPELQRRAFDAAQAVDFSLKAQKAQGIVVAAAATAGGIGLIPIPFSDSLLLTPLQISMVTAIGLIYGFGSDPNTLSTLITGSIMPLATTAVGASIAASLIEFVPGPGSIVGGLIQGVVASSLTATIGYAFLRAFHQLALMRAKGQPVTIDAAAQYLKQALPQVMQEVRQRGFKNVLPDGGDGA